MGHRFPVAVVSQVDFAPASGAHRVGPALMVPRTWTIRWPTLQASWAAGVAAALQLDLDRSRRDRSRNASRRHEAHHAVRQARHFAAAGAEKVRMTGASRPMLGAMVLLAPSDLEAPDVVAKVRSRDQPRVGEVDEVAVDRGSVEAEFRQALIDLSVAEGRRRSLQESEDRDARSRSSQTGVSEQLGVFLLGPRRHSADPPLRSAHRHGSTVSSVRCSCNRLARSAGEVSVGMATARSSLDGPPGLVR
jgi:hypothetical protein